jgi:iron complex outermembrane receptor protein
MRANEGQDRRSMSRISYAALSYGVAVSAMAFAGHAAAQAPSAPPTPQAESAQVDEVVVSAIRQTMQTSIAVKRDSVAIVDALSSKEIGDLPGQSIGEAIETITGATADRGNYGPTEVSLRGLGSFLSATTFNGREASNGSGDRAVNFGQFPSELFNGIKIYKSQQADLIEGGVAGSIELETKKPLDYGKRLVSGEIKGNYNSYQDRIKGGSRGAGGVRPAMSTSSTPTSWAISAFRWACSATPWTIRTKPMWRPTPGWRAIPRSSPPPTAPR